MAPVQLPGLSERDRQFQRLAAGCEVLVVGGGIYGAWTAYDCALRGLSVALIEAGDWGSGTSSASSKLIHGGLRYLEHGNLALVRTALHERSRLLRIAPHRVQPLRFLLPLWRGARRLPPVAIGLGLTLYDLLAGDLTGFERHRRIGVERLMQHCPQLAPEGLRAGFSYADAGEDDARMVLEVVAAAHQAGAVVLNYARALGLTGGTGSCTGVLVRDQLPGQLPAPLSGQPPGTAPREVRVTAGQTVVCAGPWLPELMAEAGIRVAVRRTKGVHLVMPPLPAPMASDEAMLLTAPQDGRVFFLIPWYGGTLLGTTDSDWQGDPGTLAVSADEAAYLLGAVQARLPGLGWTSADVRTSFAGVRTLQGEPDHKGQAASSVTREWLLTRPRAGLWVPIGGKFTSARADATLLVDGVMGVLGRSSRGRRGTGDCLLPGAPDGAFLPWLKQQTQLGVALGIDPEAAAVLARRHGTGVKDLHARIASEPGLGQRVHVQAPFLRAELTHALSDEMACTLDDVLRRRVPLAITARLDLSHVTTIAAELAAAFSWNTAFATEAAVWWWNRHRASSTMN